MIVEASRGCPYSCDFCVAPVHQGHKFRERSAKALVDEIERGYREFGIDFFYLWGDTVTLNVKSFTVFCDELIARKLPIRWLGNARADNLSDPAFVERLRQSGCWMLALGIESESDEVRKNMIKRLERQKIKAAFANMRAADIRSFAFFIFGYPGDTPETMSRTIDYAIELDPDFANFYPAVPYPVRISFRSAHEKACSPARRPMTGPGWSTGTICSEGNGLNADVVMNTINRARRRFFLRPTYVRRHFGDLVRLTFTKSSVAWQILSRAVFGARVVHTTTPEIGKEERLRPA